MTQMWLRGLIRSALRKGCSDLNRREIWWWWVGVEMEEWVMQRNCRHTRERLGQVSCCKRTTRGETYMEYYKREHVEEGDAILLG